MSKVKKNSVVTQRRKNGNEAYEQSLDNNGSKIELNILGNTDSVFGMISYEKPIKNTS
jgi:hypothetical protein